MEAMRPVKVYSAADKVEASDTFVDGKGGIYGHI